MGIGYKTAKELYLETQVQITRSSENWTSFLDSSTWMFEYTFGEQLLIYAQRPDARACATMKKWNETFNRWVKKGSTAITVLKYLDGKSMLNSIFDISDTYPRFKKTYNLWKLNKEADAEEYIEALESKYGELKSKNTLPNAIISAVQNLTEDNLKSYLDEAIKYTDMDEASFRKLFSEIVEVSVMYSALTRCGFDAKEYIDKSNFDDITFFDRPEMIAILGVTCQELTRDILRETRTFVNNKSYTFDKQINKVYFDDKENERGDLDDKLSRDGRLQNTRYKIGGESRENNREIFKSEGEILEELQKGTIRALEDDRRIDTTLERDSNNLQDTRRTVDERDDGKREYNRRVKGNKPRKMVSTNEQLETYNRGNNNERVHLYLDDLLSESEQINFIDNLVLKIDDQERIISEEELIEYNESKGIEQTVTENSTDTKSGKDKLQSFFIPQNIPSDDRLQFEITDENLGVGGLKEKFRFNTEAIKTLKQCEEENRLATKEEQEMLSRYVGWGGLQDAFNVKKLEWKNEYEELKELLTEEEYNKAKASTLTAFYTPPIVISSIYEALENMGFKNGNILEPSCGIGNFIGRLPKSMQDSSVYGIELDSITGRIAKQLYQKSNISIQGFEDSDLPDNAFDIAIGNVPFGDFKVTDKRYDKHNFLIHDYFFAKSIDKVRAGGIIAFVTSKGTLDKENPSFRKYIAQRADLIGAIRLPDNTFKSNAGTQTTTDIIFLQKKEHPIETEQEWIHLGIDENGIKMNQYFIDNPQMVLGNMEMTSTQYGGLESTCKPFANSNLKELLKNAITNLKGKILNLEIDEFTDEIDDSIPADINVRNYSYTSKNNKIYYRENSRMYPQDLSETSINRIKGLIDIRDCTRNLIELQNTNALDDEIKNEQERLNSLYDNFVKEYGRISDRANKKAFEEDSSYYLLCSLEILDENGNFKNKADMFTKRTIKTDKEVQNVVTANDALIVCISEKAKVDLDYMSSLIGETKEKIVEELQGLIFKLPNTDNYVTSDEYLSGNIREKLREAEQAFELDKSLDINIERLKNALPKDLTIGEIAAKLGSTWIPAEIMEQFMYELLGTPWDLKRHIRMNYSEHNATWSILGKSKNRGNVKVYSTYGTSRVNGYKVLEATLNLKTIKVYDTIVNAEGKQERILNKKETAIAQAKQELIKEEFDSWIWKDIDRRNKLVKLYNERFNSIKPREYNGEHIKFVGMNPEITLREHQVNAIAHILYGNNTLLAHVVGAGKTFEMVAAAMESKRLGLSNKALFVVPNHIIEQFASEFLQLYPSANILVATQKDFSTNYRKRFCGKIATGEYDAVIIGHSQFEKIPMSPERQRIQLNRQLEEIVEGIKEAKEAESENFTIKDLERSKKRVEEKLKKLNDQTRKDNVIYFEELGVDKMFIDEAHNYKNLYTYSKMKNVSGISQVEAQKSSDLYMKCRYLDEVTGNKGIVFATGTPISNSMVELYTMQRYLQYDTLVKHNLHHFDAWASVFGEVTTTMELAPEGTGYRSKTSFSKFNNLPELISMFKEVADIQTEETLNLPVPDSEYHNVVTQPSEFQKEIVRSLGERAEDVRNGGVDPRVDNMLKITNDGRKLALDQRLVNELLPDYEDSKVSICAKNVYDIYKDSMEDKKAQLIFCDLSTPKDLIKSSEYFDIIETDKESETLFMDVYTDLKCKLMKLGIPRDEITFIHEADTEVKKKEVFSKVRNGTIRVLMGSTSKMGAGTNVQKRLIALHDLDCPWRPSDLKQRLR